MQQDGKYWKAIGISKAKGKLDICQAKSYLINGLCQYTSWSSDQFQAVHVYQIDHQYHQIDILYITYKRGKCQLQ